MDFRNNHVLRKLRYALNLKDRDIVKIFDLGGLEIEEAWSKQFLSKEDTPMFRELTDRQLEYFLDGLITYRRGPRGEKKKTRVLMPEKK